MTDFSYEVTVPLIHKAGVTGVIRSEYHICKEGGAGGGRVKKSIGL